MAKNSNRDINNISFGGWGFLIKFIAAFCLLYFGTKAVIGLTVPGGYYSAFINHYLNYPSWLRYSLMYGSHVLVAAFGFNTYLPDAYHIRMVNGHGVRLVYACLGYGLLSFWVAFVFAGKEQVISKLKWMAGGCAIIWLINVIRISLILIVTNSNWHFNIPVNQHTLYNVVVYACIFLMAWLFKKGHARNNMLAIQNSGLIKN